jgi:large subunit ribosomal protein L22
VSQNNLRDQRWDGPPFLYFVNQSPLETPAMSRTTDYQATHRFARISVRKVRPLLDLIRGHYADDALDVLKYMPHRGARLVEQVLKSAMANAEDKGVRNVGDLIVTDARGDGGPMFKRLMPRARGMAYLIRRRTAHIAIGLGDQTKATPSPEQEAEKSHESGT